MVLLLPSMTAVRPFAASEQPGLGEEALEKAIPKCLAEDEECSPGAWEWLGWDGFVSVLGLPGWVQRDGAFWWFLFYCVVGLFCNFLLFCCFWVSATTFVGGGCVFCWLLCFPLQAATQFFYF